MLDRKYMIKKRLELSRDEVLAYSNNIIKKIKELDFYNENMLIASYMPIGNEIEIKLDNKNICYPKIEGDDLVFYIPKSFSKGVFDILEPIGRKVDKKDIDLIIVPLLYFDKFNNRMGYGRGYYDRYLKDYKGITVGVAYDFQEVDMIDAKPTDVKLDYIVKGEIK
jgi:5-formyltetrahydrofolate cyclo-ligase